MQQWEIDKGISKGIDKVKNYEIRSAQQLRDIESTVKSTTNTLSVYYSVNEEKSKINI